VPPDSCTGDKKFSKLNELNSGAVPSSLGNEAALDSDAVGGGTEKGSDLRKANDKDGPNSIPSNGSEPSLTGKLAVIAGDAAEAGETVGGSQDDGNHAADVSDMNTEASYIPQSTWNGPMAGYLFTTRDNITGYFRDMTSLNDERHKREEGASVTPQFIAADAFQGARPGYSFKTGEQGIGYYVTTPPNSR
jgi:hypothetical protein